MKIVPMTAGTVHKAKALVDVGVPASNAKRATLFLGMGT